APRCAWRRRRDSSPGRAAGPACGPAGHRAVEPTHRSQPADLDAAIPPLAASQRPIL
ncbi:MAG: hypothetical protein AVDCRST_MAG73-1503, partial [uncultured Thermomicrobiales bacterium]